MTRARGRAGRVGSGSRILAALLGVRLRIALHVVRDREWARLAVVGAFAVLGVGAMVGEYRFLERAFRALAGLGVAGAPLTLYALEAFFALILVLGVGSGAVTGAAIFFRLAENRLLLVAPVSTRTIFVLRGLETALVTSWAFGLVAAPALLALGRTYARAGGFYLAAALLLAAFLVLAASLGTLLTLGIALGLGRLQRRAATASLAAVVLLAAGLLVGRSVVPTRADLAVMFEPGLRNGTTVAVHFVEDRFARWPSHPFAAALFGLATGGGSHPVRALGWSLAWPLLALLGALGPGARLYGRLVQEAAEGLAFAQAAGRPPTAPRPGRRLRGASGPFGALLAKEWRTLVRSPEELSRGAFLGFLLLLYTVLFLRVPVPAESGREDVLARLVAFSLLAAGYFLTTLALRFVFPALSSEGRAVWILLASPSPLETLLLANLALYVPVTLLGLGGITLVGAARLGLSGAGLALFGGLLLVMDVTVLTVAVALGACWPDFRGRPADTLATSGGGLLTVGICLVYVAACAWAGNRFVLAWLTGAPPARLGGPLVLVAAVSAALIGAGVLTVRRRLRALEVA